MLMKKKLSFQGQMLSFGSHNKYITDYIYIYNIYTHTHVYKSYLPNCRTINMQTSLKDS